MKKEITEKDKEVLKRIEEATGLPCMFDDKRNLIVAISDNFQAYYDHLPQENDDFVTLIYPEHHYITREEMSELLNYRFMKADDVYNIIINK